MLNTCRTLIWVFLCLTLQLATVAAAPRHTGDEKETFWINMTAQDAAIFLQKWEAVQRQLDQRDPAGNREEYAFNLLISDGIRLKRKHLSLTKIVPSNIVKSAFRDMSIRESNGDVLFVQSKGLSPEDQAFFNEISRKAAAMSYDSAKILIRVGVIAGIAILLTAGGQWGGDWPNAVSDQTTGPLPFGSPSISENQLASAPVSSEHHTDNVLASTGKP